MDQNVNTPQANKAVKPWLFRQILFACLCALIMACLVFFVFPKRSLSPRLVRMQSQQIAVPSPSISEAAVPAPSYWPSVTLGTDTSSLWLVALNTEYHGKFVGAWGYTSIEWPDIQNEINAREVAVFNSRPNMFFTSILGSASFIENGVTKEYVLTQSQVDPNSNEWSQRAILGGAVLAEKDGQWSVESLQKDIAIAGQGGRISQPIVLNIGKNHPAFQLNDKFSEQGGMHGTLSTYAYVGGVIRNVMHIDEAFGDNTDANHHDEPNAPAVKFDTSITVLSGPNEFYDLKVTSSGANFSSDRKKAIQFNTVSTYSFDGEKYVKQAGS